MAFTFVELLTILTVVAVLAAVLVPALAAARAKSGPTTCLQNLHQISTAAQQYTQDYDQKLFAHRFNCNNGGVGATVVCPGYLNNGTRTADSANLSGGAEFRYYWAYMLRPYVKTYQTFVCPQNPSAFYPGGSNTIAFNSPGSVGVNYGGQNSYGYNNLWLAPAGSFGAPNGQPGAVSLAAIPRSSNTVLVTDASYYVSAPDVQNQSGLTVTANCSSANCTNESAFLTSQGSQFTSYWKNLGNANWSASGGTLTAANALPLIKARHNSQLNVLFVDGHLKAKPYAQVVGDICLWTTDAEGAHPNCK